MPIGILTHFIRNRGDFLFVTWNFHSLNKLGLEPGEKEIAKYKKKVNQSSDYHAGAYPTLSALVNEKVNRPLIGQ